MLGELLVGILGKALYDTGKLGGKTLLTKEPTQRAIKATAKDFPHISCVADALDAWSQSDEFLSLIEDVRNAGDAPPDERFIESFVKVGRFHDGITSTFSTAPKVIETFAKHLEKEIYSSNEGLFVEGQRATFRHKELQTDLRDVASQIHRLREEIGVGVLGDTDARAGSESREIAADTAVEERVASHQPSSSEVISLAPDARFASQISPPHPENELVAFKNTAPIPVTDFVGRQALLDDLSYDDNACHIIAIVGLLGIGKTTLLRQLADLFGVERVFWFSFRAGLVSLEDLLTRLARFLDSRPGSDHEVVRQVESCQSIQDKVDLIIEQLNRGAHKLIFDRVNLADEDAAVESFLVVLRERLRSGTLFVADRSKPRFITPLDEATGVVKIVTLEGFTSSEVQEFMTRKGVSISTSVADSLAADLDGIPLALELLAALLERNASEEAILGHANQAKEKVVEYLFNEVYRRLESDEIGLLTTASIFSLPFLKDQLLSVHKATNGRNGVAAFDGLRRKALIKDFGDDYYQLHEVVSSLALTHLQTDLNELRSTVADVLVELMPDQVTVHLEAVLLYIKAGDFNSAAGLASSMMAREFILYNSNFAETMIGAFKEENVSTERWLWLLSDKGRIAEFWRDYDEAETHYSNMLQLAKKSGNKTAEAIALQRLGNINLYHDDVAAEEYFGESMFIKRDLGDIDGQAEIHNNLGLIYSHRGKFDLALSEYEKGLALREEIGSSDWEKLPLITNLGILYARNFEWDKAGEYSDRALGISKDLGSPYHIAKATYNLAKNDMVRGDADAAKAKLNEVLAIVEGLDLWEIEDMAFTALGLTYYNSNNLDEAISSFVRVAEIRKTLKDLASLAPIYFDLATFHLKKADLVGALKFHLEGILLFEHIDDESAARLYANNTQVLAKELDRAGLDSLVAALKKLRKRATGYTKSCVYETLGEIYLEQLDHERAGFKALYLETKMLSSLGHHQEQVSALTDLAVKYQERGRQGNALEINREALDLAVAHSLSDFIGTIHFNTGNCYAQLEMLSEAEEQYQQALTAPKTRELEQMISHNLGEVLREQGKIKEGIIFLRQGLEHSRDVDDIEGTIHALNNLGLAYAQLDQPTDALNSLNEALELAHKHSLHRDLSNTLMSLGNLYMEDDPSRAQTAYEESLAAAKMANNIDLEEKAMLSLAFAHRQLKTFGKIEQDFKRVAERANELEHYENFLKILVFAGEMNFDEKEIGSAAEMFEKALFFALVVSANRLKQLPHLSPGLFQVQPFTFVLAHLLRVLDGALKEERSDLAKGLYSHLTQKKAKGEYWGGTTLVDQYLEVIGNYLDDKRNEALVDYVTDRWARLQLSISCETVET